MKDFVKLSAEEKKVYLEQAALRSGLTQLVIEKDFWVCWLLDILFKTKISEHLTFKGGTSLSKVFSLIKRFSEDIDLSIEKSFFGFEGEKDLEKVSRKQQKILLKELSEKCREYVQGDLLTELRDRIKAEIPEGEEWKLVVDEMDPDSQSLLFFYPCITDRKEAEYVSPVVKLEFGARSEHWPVSMQTVQPYLQEIIPESMQGEVSLRVLNVERTFWEKATILHKYAHYPADKKIPVRQSRHYYDIYCLINSEYFELAKKDNALLDRVAQHKSIYFRTGWASYDTARKGTLKLIPGDDVLSRMAADYKAMEIMFFEAPPAWEEILDCLQKFEQEFNLES